MKAGEDKVSKGERLARNSVRLDRDGVIRLTYVGPQSRATMRTLTDSLLQLMAKQREAGREVLVLSNMRKVKGSDSGARLEAKWFLEETDYDALAVVGNRYLQPLIFFVLRDYRRGRAVKYFADEKSALRWLLDSARDNGFHKLKLTNRLRWAVYPLILLLLAATALSWQQAQRRLEVEAARQFDAELLKDAEALKSRMRSYIDALYGFRGLFHASDDVSEREFHDYFDSLDLGQSYPGFNSINYVTRVAEADKMAFLAKIRNDRSLRPEGNPGVAITPESNHSEHFIVTYLGVEGAGSGQGVDLATSNERQATLESARDSGEPTATDTIFLLNAQGKEQPDRPGFLVTLPIYKANVPDSLVERRANLEGFVNAVFDYSKLFDQTFSAAKGTGVGIRILDNNDTAVYQLAPVGNASRYTAIPIDVAGRTWKIEIRVPKLFGISKAEAVLPSYIIALGVSLAAFLAITFWMQNRGRQRALDLASDMTEDIKLERNAAVATKNKDEAILSSIGDGVLVLNTEGVIVLFNKAAEAISGFSATEAVGRPYKQILNFFSAKDGSEVGEFVTDALTGKRAEMARNTILKRKDGSDVPVADSAAPVRDVDGRVTGAVVVFRDVTREKQLEQMKDELLAVASHELRTPMGAVRANVSMILSGDYGPVNKELVEPLTDIKASTIRLVDLVNDLLNVARLEAGRMKFMLSEFDIQGTLEGIVSDLAPLGKEKGVAITCRPGRAITVQADVDKIKQVLTNLIGNSLKFTTQGNITVAGEVQKGAVEVIVKDTGIGISSEDQQKLFGKFQQITSVQEGKPAGTGLGLYISREIVRKMGGDLRIKQSESGKGSVFAFTVPLPGTPEARQAKTQLEHEAALHPDQK
ncbi:MAG TPA: CHASE domain-containing protein [Candidatus Saccharimonadales bacterium]